ncbi:BnaA01g30670D [Brassica napus]|uniref:BnaA01g30670D protein n=1 Tax=Brassica napus TaxID=3708 RepID=A0A078INE7_BRANA|nr:BnaA01g30670D [Brassica napus]
MESKKIFMAFFIMTILVASLIHWM